MSRYRARVRRDHIAWWAEAVNENGKAVASEPCIFGERSARFWAPRIARRAERTEPHSYYVGEDQ
jgi:hypothetical protein